MDQDRGDAPSARWVATVGTLAGAGLLVSVVRERVGAAISGPGRRRAARPADGLLNRRGFEEAFDVELERARRTEQSLSVIVGDLDRFKRVNDQLGHAAGDAMLRQVGRAARARQAQLGHGGARRGRGVRAS